MPSPLPIADALPLLLRTERFGRRLRWTAETASTNADALRWATEGAPEGALAGAEHQTAGRGRYGRPWADAPGQSLLLSLVLRPSLPHDNLGLIPLAAGVAVAEALSCWVAPLVPSLKWPNDVLLRGRKVAGLLLEGHLSAGGDAGPTLVLGLGLNVNQTTFPDELEPRATSLALEVGRPIARPPLLAELLLAFEHHYDRLHTDGGEGVRAAFETRMSGRGTRATVRSMNHAATLRGTLLGVAAGGALRLQTEEGERLLHAGDVTLHLPN